MGREPRRRIPKQVLTHVVPRSTEGFGGSDDRIVETEQSVKAPDPVDVPWRFGHTGVTHVVVQRQILVAWRQAPAVFEKQTTRWPTASRIDCCSAATASNKGRSKG